MPDHDRLREAEADGRRTAAALDALRAWLLTEDAYERGGVPDEVLTYMQDRIADLLGPDAETTAGDFVRRERDSGRTMAEIARDRSALMELLELVDGERHRDNEFEWRATTSE